MEMMIARRINVGVLKFDDSALKVMESYRQLQPSSKEAGGILLGRHLKNEKDIIIDEVTVPQPEDRRSRFNFLDRLHINVLHVNDGSMPSKPARISGYGIRTPSQTQAHRRQTYVIGNELY